MKQITFFKQKTSRFSKPEKVEAPVDPEWKTAYVELGLWDRITIQVGEQFITVQSTPAGISSNLRSFRLKQERNL